MRCAICNIPDGIRFQRATDGTNRWRQVREESMGDKEWFPSQVSGVQGNPPRCTGFVCDKRAKEKVGK